MAVMNDDHVESEPGFVLDELRSRGCEREQVDVVDDLPLLRHPRILAILGSTGKKFPRASIALRLWYVQHAGKHELVGRVRFGEAAEGPPACAHGGAVATALDEAFSILVWRHIGYPLVPGNPTVQLNVSYRNFTPLLRDLKITVKIDKIDGRKVYLSGKIEDTEQPRVCAEGQALFLKTTRGADNLPYEQACVLFGSKSTTSIDTLVELMLQAREVVRARLKSKL